MIYESFFLSYIDGELDEPARQAVAAFVRRHPEKGILLQQLQHTVDTPDLDIVFPDKESLYKKKRKEGSPGCPFARIAAAALVIGAIGLLILPFLFMQEKSVRGQYCTNPGQTGYFIDGRCTSAGSYHSVKR